MKLKFTYFIILSILIFTLTTSNNGGKMGVSTSGCGSCHGNANSNTTMTLKFNGNTITSYTPGTNYAVTLDVNNSVNANTPSKSGFDLTVNKGTLSNAPSGTMLMGSELHHTSGKVAVSGKTTWSFNWTAPSSGSGSVAFNIAGNATNGNGSDGTGDQWAITTVSLSEATTTVPDTAKLSIAASATTITAGASVTFTATPTKPGTSPSYQWYKNNTTVGSNSTTYTTTTLQNNDTIKCIMTSNLAGVVGSPATSNKIVIKVNPATGSIASQNKDGGIQLAMAHKQLYITYEQNKSVQIELYNLSGKKLLNQSTLTNSQIDLQTLANGIYIVKVLVDGQSYSQKLIVE